MNLYSLFLKNFSKNKKIVFNDEILTYKDFRNEVDSILRSNLIKNKNKIAIISSNQKYLSSLLFACSYSGISLILINKSLKINQINKQLKLTKPDLAIYDGDDFTKIKFCKKKIISNEFFSQKPKKNNKIYRSRFKKDKDFIVTFSSGTTSLPKAVVYSQEIKYLRYLHMQKTYKVKKSDNIFSASPIDHSLGQRLLFLALLNGSSFVYSGKYNFVDISKKVKEFKISFAVLPSNYLALLKKKIISKKIFIKKIVSAASTLNLIDKKQMIKSGIELYEMYGAAEIGTVTSINLKKFKNKITSVGKILKGISIKIVDKKLRNRSTGEIGEIICKTPLKFKGYYQNKILTKKSILNGYFKTGDLGYLDNENYLHYVSRKQDVVNTGGKNIYPIDIEKELLKLKFLREVAVIGIKDKFFGQVVFAVCVIKKKLPNPEKKIKEFLSKKISSYQLPLGYAFVNKLPKNHLGKIQKKKLRDRYNKKKIDLSKSLRRILN